MLARRYHPHDAAGVDRILRGQGMTSLDLDELFLTGSRGEPSGLLVLRPGAFVHELQCGADGLRRLRAEALTNFAIAHAKATGLKSAMFLVRAQNLAMQRFVESLGAVQQSDPGDLLYTLTPQ